MSGTLFARRPSFDGTLPIKIGKQSWNVPAGSLIAHGNDGDQRIAWVAFIGNEGRLELHCLVEAGEVPFPEELTQSVLAEKFGIKPQKLPAQETS